MSEQRKNPTKRTNELLMNEMGNEIGWGHLRLELLNLARGVAVVSLLPVLGVGAVHDVVAEVHRVAARPRLALALALASDGGLLRAQSGEGTARAGLVDYSYVPRGGGGVALASTPRRYIASLLCKK